MTNHTNFFWNNTFKLYLQSPYVKKNKYLVNIVRTTSTQVKITTKIPLNPTSKIDNKTWWITSIVESGVSSFTWFFKGNDPH